MIATRNHLLLSLCVASAAFVGVGYGEEGKPTGAEPVREGASKVQDKVTEGAKTIVDPMRDKTPKEVEAKTATDIRQRLASIANNAATKNGFDDLLGSLSKVNRDRIAENRFKGYEVLNAAIAKFRDNFKANVGKDFDFKSALIEDIKVFQGSDKDHATVTLVPKVEVAMNPDAPKTDGAKPLTPTDPPYSLTGDEKTAGVTLNLVNEGVIGNGWRLNLVNPTADSLSSSLIKHLDMLTKDIIPKDSDKAHRLAAQHIFEALVDARPEPAPMPVPEK